MLRGEHFELMKDGAILANTGHFNVEIDIPALRELRQRERRPADGRAVDLSDGRRLFLLAEGRLVNLAAAEGHPAAVMDMSFANQALSAEHVVKHHRSSRSGCYEMPRDIDDEVARLKLASLGVEIDR